MRIERQRAAVIVVVDNALALIRRDREDRSYYLLPGGGVDPGETPEEAAVREAREEIGWDVSLTGLVARNVFGGGTREQLYYTAAVAGGRFGMGDGLEMSFTSDSPDGSHTPVLVPLGELCGLDARPMVLVERVADGSLATGQVLELVDDAVASGRAAG